MTHALTAFQESTLQAVRSLLAATRDTPVSEELAGDREKYLILSFAGYRVLIYEDGAEILGNGLDLRFEKEDFQTLDALRQGLLSALRDAT